jgi:hypothetical protein
MQMPHPKNLALRRAVWIAALAFAAIGSSVVTGVTWVAVGYGFRYYPLTLDSFTWGAAIGVGAVIATAFAAEVGGLRPLGWVVGMLESFATTFAGYEIALYAAIAPGLPGKCYTAPTAS